MILGNVDGDNNGSGSVIEVCCCCADYNSISKFLNRLLGIEVMLQNALFRYFMSTLSAIIMQAKRNGRWDMGILGKCRGIPGSVGASFEMLCL